MAGKRKVPKGQLVGRKIVDVRSSTQSEKSANAWYQDYIVFVLDDGSKIFAMGDEEGNYPGTIIHEVDGKQHYVFPKRA